mmetsp:Transcript_5613/g.22083  ORF Transcript_5613/g.22083 Transcript_5613/m.22083 type:complete len:241 (+) Transcript_5613:278-1000(+)
MKRCHTRLPPMMTIRNRGLAAKLSSQALSSISLCTLSSSWSVTKSSWFWSTTTSVSRPWLWRCFSGPDGGAFRCAALRISFSSISTSSGYSHKKPSTPKVPRFSTLTRDLAPTWDTWWKASLRGGRLGTSWWKPLLSCTGRPGGRAPPVLLLRLLSKLMGKCVMSVDGFIVLLTELPRRRMSTADDLRPKLTLVWRRLIVELRTRCVSRMGWRKTLRTGAAPSATLSSMSRSSCCIIDSL